MRGKREGASIGGIEAPEFAWCRVACTRNRMFFNPKQTRHPERSAAQICRITSALWRAVEEPVPSVAEGTPAVLRLRMLFKAFRPPKPDPGGPAAVFPWSREQAPPDLGFEDDYSA